MIPFYFKNNTVNSGFFARVLFSRNFASMRSFAEKKPCEMVKQLCRLLTSINHASHKSLTTQIYLLTLFAKIKFSQKFLNLQNSKTCVKWPLSKRPKIGIQDQFWLHTGQKYCRMLQGELSAILSTFIKVPFCFVYF